MIFQQDSYIIIYRLQADYFFLQVPVFLMSQGGLRTSSAVSPSGSVDLVRRHYAIQVAVIGKDVEVSV